MTGPGRTLALDTDAGPAEAYLVGDGPGVLFYVDALGLRARTRAMADRIASWGHTVLVPHVFHRDGTADDLAPQQDLREPGAREAFFGGGVMDRIAALTPDLAEPDARVWVATLREHAAAGPLGVTGYCMGARLAVRTGAWFPDDVAAVGGFHGGGLATEEPDSPHRVLAADSSAEHAFGHADHDRSMPPEAVAELGRALEAQGRPYRNDVMAGAAHGYTMSDTSEFHEVATERHFEVLRDLFRRRLTVGG